jgi:hypothetical protein
MAWRIVEGKEEEFFWRLNPNDSSDYLLVWKDATMSGQPDKPWMAALVLQNEYRSYLSAETPEKAKKHVHQAAKNYFDILVRSLTVPLTVPENAPSMIAS